MSLNSTTTISGPFTLNDVSDTFAYGFTIFDDAELEFVMFNNATGELSVADPNDYSVTGVGVDGGGNVVFDDPPVTGYTGWVRRKGAFLQAVTSGSPLQAATVIRMADRAVMYALELREVADRSLRFSIGETCDALPPPAQRAGKVFCFDDDGLIDLSIDTVDVATVAGLASEIVALGAIADDISDVAGMAADIATVAGEATHIATLAPVAASIALCAANMTAITAAPTHATNAAASAVAAAASETNAATSESNALTSKNAAATSATAAAASATSAATAKTAAETAQTAAEAAEASIQQALNGVVFEWDSGTADADPGAGAIRADNATLGSATYLYVSETDGLGAAVSAILATWDDSTSSNRAFITLRKRSAPVNFAMFAISSAQTDGGVYRKFPVSYIAHSGTFSDGDVLGVIIERTGDQGPSGPGSGDVLAANGGSEYAALASTFRGNIASAPISPDYLVKTANAELSAERVVTDTSRIAWDWATGGQAKADLVAGGITATYLASDAVTTVKILDNNVTLAKLATIATDRLLGRDTAGTGNVEVLTVSGGIEFTGTGGIQRSALTGDVTAAAGSSATTIANDAVTTAKVLDGAISLAKQANIATDRLIGRDTAGTGVPEVLTVSGGVEFSGAGGIQRSALTGDVTAAAGSNATSIAAGVVTFAMMAAAAVATLAELMANTASKLVSVATLRSTVTPVALLCPAATTVTMTIASPAVVSWTAHGLVAGQPVVFTTSGALPTGIVSGTTYYVIAAGLTANAFEVSATRGGSAVNTSGSQSGTHTATPNIYIDASLGCNFYITLTRNVIFDVPQNTFDGQSGCIEIIQDGTGSRTGTFNSSWDWNGATAPTLTTTASGWDLLSFYVPQKTHFPVGSLGIKAIG